MFILLIPINRIVAAKSVVITATLKVKITCVACVAPTQSYYVELKLFLSVYLHKANAQKECAENV